MTKEEILKQIQRIREYAEKLDDESAHAAEDGLLWLFVEALANNKVVDIEGCAKEIMVCENISFARWCA